MPLRLALIGHVEHITLGDVARLPVPGEIVHLGDLRVFPGGGGGVALFQMLRSTAEVHVFTALGNDEAGNLMRERLRESGAVVHAALREAAHTRDLVLVTPDRERTIFVLGKPLHPARADDLPWDILGSCDAAYFTGEDPQTLVAARAAKVLVVTARRRHVLAASRVAADVVVGSVNDERERSSLRDYDPPPRALVMTEGERGGYVETAAGTVRFPASTAPVTQGTAYGAGDSFAGALTAGLGAGLEVVEACTRAARNAAAVLGARDPLSGQVALDLPDR